MTPLSSPKRPKSILLLVVFSLLLVIHSSFIASLDCDEGIARANKVNNKLVFYHNEPLSAYKVAFTFENISGQGSCNNPEQTMVQSVINANYESGSQGGIPYDAIIIQNGTPRDMAIVWEDKTVDNALARVDKIEGIYAFAGCDPICNYEIVLRKDVTSKKMKWFGECIGDNGIVLALMKIADKQKINYDAALITNSANDILIKFTTDKK